MPRILLHTCCGPCTAYPLPTLRQGGWTVHGFFYNPYIQPYREFQLRLDALRQLAEIEELPLILREDYDLEDYLRQTAYRETERCRICYAKRLEAAARLAKKSNFDAFTSTLLYSKQQKHELIRTLAEAAARKYGIPFYYEDFRIGWRAGQERSKALGLYRQQYCGCILSERDRFQPKPARPRGNGRGNAHAEGAGL